jgi:hypothetical protein
MQNKSFCRAIVTHYVLRFTHLSLILQRNVADKITKKTKAWYVSPITSQVRRRKYHAQGDYNRDSVY